MNDHERKRVGETTSVCPVCLERIPATIVAEGEKVFVEKSCAGHGQWKVAIWRGEPPYEDWARPREAVLLDGRYGAVQRGCPFDCGLCVAHRQYPCSVLLEVTGRCNLACPVCFADAGHKAPRAPEPDVTTIDGWYERVMEAAGPCNIQLSGGEPTLRGDLPEIVALGRRKGFSFIQVNTNGLKLAGEAGHAERLRDAGLSTVFLQFDGTEDDIHLRLRGRPLAREKEAAIERSGAAGLGVVLVPTLVPGINTANIGSIVRFAIDHAPVVRGVHFQPVSHFGRYPFFSPSMGRITLPEVMEAIEGQTAGLIKKGDFLPPGTENARCSFHGSFVLMAGGRLKCTTPSLRACCSRDDGAQGLRRTVSTVARQWSAPSPTACCRLSEGASTMAPITRKAPEDRGDGVIDLDAFLARAVDYGFFISCMAFQDAWTLDIERLRDCCISVMSPDGRLVPFCAYNLTSEGGKGLYRDRRRGPG